MLDSYSFFEKNSINYAKKTAIIVSGQSYTYGELYERVKRKSEELIKQGIKENDRVAVSVSRSIDYPVYILAIMKIGAVFVPVDPDYPIKYKDYICRQCQVKTVLFDNTSYFEFSLDKNINFQYSTGLSYIIFTSGTSGDPKGVMISKDSLQKHLTALSDRVKVENNDIYIHFASIGFSAAVRQLLLPLISGATLVIANENERKDPIEFLTLIKNTKTTVLQLTPSYFKAIMKELDDIDLETKKKLVNNSLRLILFASEPLEMDVVKKWLSQYSKNQKIYNMYGQTETTGVFLIKEVISDDSSYLVPLGKPISFAKVFILDENNRIQKDGEIGEICIDGDLVLKGYVGDFISEDSYDFLDIKNNGKIKLWKTGDLGLININGDIEFKGRKDQQIKIRGRRINRDQIEKVLKYHPDLTDCIVINHLNINGDEELIGYIIPGEFEPSDTELREYLLEQLPEYMVPSYFVTIKKIPLTINGKLDRMSLPIPDKRIRNTDEEYVEPRTILEEEICEIWKKILRIDRIGVNDSFLSIGGHSLLATRLISLIRNKYNIEISLKVLFEYPTIAKLSTIIEKDRGKEKNNNLLRLPLLKIVNKEENIPLSFVQQRLWFLEQLLPDLGLYNDAICFRLTGDLDIISLVKSLNIIVNRHESLRTKIISVNGVAYQKVFPGDFTLKIKKIKKESIERELKKEIEKPFDFNKEVLFRGLLLDLSEKEKIIVFTFHHIISDGWSMGIFLDELSILYEACLKDEAPNLEELPIQYTDFTVWQRQWLQGEELERQLSYWKKQLYEASILVLPSKPRPADPTYAGKIYKQYLSKDILDKLNKFSKEKNLTLFMVMLAAFKGVLSKVSNQNDIVIGTPIANRRVSEVEKVIGFFVNTLVFRTDCSGNPTFEELAKRVEKTALEAYEHQDVPFEQLVDYLNISRDLSRSPIFQVVFVLQNSNNSEIRLRNIEVNPIYPLERRARFDLTLNVLETKKGLCIEYEYATDLFEEKHIKKLAQYYERFIESILITPSINLSAVPMLDEEELTKLTSWSNINLEYRDKSLHELFEDQVKRTPENVAVVFENKTLTYKELNEKANQVAHYLKNIGVGPENVVCIFQDRNINFLISIIAIFKVGAAYISLNPNIPVERNKLLLKTINTEWVFIDKIYEYNFKNVYTIKNVLSVENILAQDFSKENLSVCSNPKNLAYIFFTSGSTGDPKGAMVENQGMINHLRTKIDDLKLNYLDAVAQTSVQTFDVSAWQFLAVLLVGGRVVIFGGDTAWEPKKLLNLIEKEKITLFETVPTHMSLILDELESNISPRFSSLRWLILNGEAISKKIYNRWFSLYPNIPMITTYGATECSDDISHYKIPLKNYEEEGFFPIGGVLDNSTIYILDTYLNPVPLGTIGEIFIGGLGVGRGYLNDPERTSKSFLPNPFSLSSDSKIYKTGDLGRWIEDGTIESLGRTDHQIKIRGFRVELGEIESILQKIEGIKQCVVLVREDIPGQKKLVAYVEADTEKEEAVKKCNEVCKAKLPDYMRPNQIIVVNELPLMSNGKINRQALPKPKDREGLDPYEGPQGLLEMGLAKSWSEVLNIDNIGRNDNFFNLGGNSLIATQLVSRIRSNQSIEIPLRSIFKYPVLKDLAKIIEKEHSTKDLLPSIKKVTRDHKIPLSFSQQRLWFLEQLLPELGLYHVPLCFKLSGDLDKESLAKSLKQIVNRHEILRTKIVTVKGKAHQEISSTEFNLDIEKIKEKELFERIKIETDRPFDFNNELLFRGILLEITPKKYVLILTFHHIIFDGWSMGIFIEELNTCYKYYVKNKEPQLEKLSIQYADFTVWQRQWLQGEVLNKQLLYWKNKLYKASNLVLPSKSRPKKQSYKGKLYNQILSKDILSGLNEFAKERNLTLFIVLVAAFNGILSIISNQEDIVIGTSIANRRVSEVEKLIGFFINALVIRTDCSNDPTFEELVKRVERVTLEAYEHQDVPFALLVDFLNIPRDLSKHPLFQVNFVLQNTEDSKVELQDLKIESIKIPERIAKFDLTLNIMESKTGLVIEYEYASDLFNEEHIEKLASYYEQFIKIVLKTPNICLSELFILKEEYEMQREAV